MRGSQLSLMMFSVQLHTEHTIQQEVEVMVMQCNIQEEVLFGNGKRSEVG